MSEITVQNITLRWRILIVSAVIFALITFIISVLLPAKYQSDISMIVIQKQSTEKIDAFSASKSAEFLSNVFTKVIYTTSFFNSVQDAPFDVRQGFSQDPEKRKREWERMVDVKKVNNTSIINISVLDASRTTAEETAKAIAYILIENGQEYHGGGERVEVRLIDGPNTPLRPTVPHIFINTAVGAVFGVFVAMVFLLFSSREKEISYREKQYNENVDSVDEPLDEGDHEELVSSHFQNVRGSIKFDEEVEKLHKRIGDFNQNSDRK